MPEERIRIDAAVIEGGDPHAIIEPVWWLARLDPEEAYAPSVERFSAPQRQMHALAWYLAEVNNGGHEQFLQNVAGMLWSEALHGAQALGLSALEDLLRQIGARLGAPPARDHDERARQVAACARGFDDLDDRFHAGVGDAVEPAMGAFMRAHPDAFVFEGIVDRPPPIDLGDLVDEVRRRSEG